MSLGFFSADRGLKGLLFSVGQENLADFDGLGDRGMICYQIPDRFSMMDESLKKKCELRRRYSSDR